MKRGGIRTRIGLRVNMPRWIGAIHVCIGSEAVARLDPPSRSVPHSSRGLGHRPLKAEITGSNPVCGTSTHLAPILSTNRGNRVRGVPPSVPQSSDDGEVGFRDRLAHSYRHGSPPSSPATAQAAERLSLLSQPGASARERARHRVTAGRRRRIRRAVAPVGCRLTIGALVPT